MADTETKPIGKQWIPRFSLLTVLLLMALLACGITIWQQWRELRPMRVELRKLRNEVGALTIEDESKIHAIQMPTNEDLTWKWRIWVPEGANVSANYRWGDVPPTGVPKSHRAIQLFPGENIVSLRAVRSRDGKQWTASFSTPSAGYGIEISADQQWMNWPQMVSTGEGVGAATTVLDDQSSVHILSRQRMGPYSDSTMLNKLKEPTAGYIIWLERQ